MRASWVDQGARVCSCRRWPQVVRTHCGMLARLQTPGRAGSCGQTAKRRRSRPLPAMAAAGSPQFRGETGPLPRVTRPVRARRNRMAVFMRDQHPKPLMPCSEKWAQMGLGRGRTRASDAAVYRPSRGSPARGFRLATSSADTGPRQQNHRFGAVRAPERVDEESGPISRRAAVLM